jgi:hypothetical protein
MQGHQPKSPAHQNAAHNDENDKCKMRKDRAFGQSTEHGVAPNDMGR